MKMIIQRWWLTFRIRQLDHDSNQMRRLVQEAHADWQTLDVLVTDRIEQNQRERLGLTGQLAALDAEEPL